MSRFHLYAQSQGEDFLIDLQSDFLSAYNTRVVAPVVPLSKFGQPASRLNPVIEHDGVDLVVLTHFLAAVPASALKTSVADLSGHADSLTRALDLLFQGY